MSSRPVARRRKRYSGSSSGAGDGAAHEYLGAYAAVAALVRARCMAESQESTKMDMVPGPEVVRTLSSVDQERKKTCSTLKSPSYPSPSAAGDSEARREGWGCAG
eukprot:scaffold14159_cov115-Isochrysis_galbana.AAC.1